MKFEFFPIFIVNVYIFINMLVRPLQAGLSTNSSLIVESCDFLRGYNYSSIKSFLTRNFKRG